MNPRAAFYAWLDLGRGVYSSSSDGIVRVVVCTCSCRIGSGRLHVVVVVVIAVEDHILPSGRFVFVWRNHDDDGAMREMRWSVSNSPRARARGRGRDREKSDSNKYLGNEHNKNQQHNHQYQKPWRLTGK